ncbi:MAG: hypothetical protein LBC17_04085 [Lactobacillaceae bacterium]|jgi:hypothetical protein|nr:hypothetical protein [Lactobacillaceae bacterium]
MSQKQQIYNLKILTNLNTIIDSPNTITDLNFIQEVTQLRDVIKKNIDNQNIFTFQKIANAIQSYANRNTLNIDPRVLELFNLLKQNHDFELGFFGSNWFGN